MLFEKNLQSLMIDLENQTGLLVKADVPLSRYCSARIGGAAQYLLEVNTAEQLETAINYLWKNKISYFLLGGASNVLISDQGLPGLVVINRAKGRGRMRIVESEGEIWAESGVNLGSLARFAGEKGLSGLEWAVGIPGTVGGAVVNNAGAFDGDIAHSLIVAEILQHEISQESDNILRQRWTAKDFDYSYRGSRLKNKEQEVVVLNASFKVSKSDPDLIKVKMEQLNERRKKTQPSGASLGSIFKNPIGDYAGRLIEGAGLKGLQIGGAMISREHANFILTSENARAEDVWELINVARRTVWEKYSIRLELEIQILGQFSQSEKRDPVSSLVR